MSLEFDAVERILRAITVDRPLSPNERRAIAGVLELAREAGAGEARARELEVRVTQLARENLELAAKNSALARASARDPLTGLYNRRFVLEKIESEINRSLRHGSPMALLMLDIDHFKLVNDTYGHTAGDQVLQNVARLLRESCRVYDIPCRYGGEEFCVVLPETALRSTPTVAERIRRRLETTDMEVAGAPLMITASIGIAAIEAESGDPVLNPAMLIDRADRALYSAKNHGRNRVATWDAASHGVRSLETDH